MVGNIEIKLFRQLSLSLKKKYIINYKMVMF